MPAPQAVAEALSEGARWLERNQGILSGIKASTSVTRWEDWLERPDFTAIHSAVSDYARTDPLFDLAIEQDAHSLAERKIKRGEHIPFYDRLVTHSRDYVTEELAVCAMQTRTLPAAEVYPGSNLASAQYLLGKSLPAAIAPLANRHFTRIDFAKIHIGTNARPKHAQLDRN